MKKVKRLLGVFLCISLVMTNSWVAVLADEEVLPPEGSETSQASEDADTTSANETDESIDESSPTPEEDDSIEYESGTLSHGNQDYEVNLSYGADARIPNGSKLEVAEITSDQSQYDAYVEKAAETVTEEDTEASTLPYARFFDISIVSPDGEKVEPNSSVAVTIDLKDNALETEDVTFAAVHFDGDAEESQNIASPEVISVETGDAVSFDAASFSVYGVVYYYTVDFYYTPEVEKDSEGNPVADDPVTSEYHMNGGDSMMLSDLFGKLGIFRNTSEIESLAFTDENLVKFTKDGNDYTIKSLQPFTTKEVLTITFNDGEVIVIGVEDDVASSTIPGGTATWEITGGKLIIHAGTLPDTSMGQDANQAQRAAVWPWHNYSEEITEIVVEDGVIAEGRIRHLFSNMPNLVKADLSGMDAKNVGMANDVFRESSKLEEVILSQDFAPQQMYRTFRNCSSLTTIQFGTDAKPYNPQLATGRSGNKSAFNTGDQISSAFSGCTNLTTLKFPSADLSTNDDTWTNRVKNLTALFNSANSKDKTIEMNKAKLSSGLSNGVFRLSTLKELYLREAEITKNYTSHLFHTADAAATCAAPKLDFVDMTGIAFKPESDTDMVNAYGLFKDMTALREVILTNANFGNAQNFNQVFQGSTKLEKVLMNTDAEEPGGELNIDEAVKMYQMFKGCTALEELDLSGFGKMDNIVSMENMFKECKALRILDISNMDNSRIKPQNSNHPANGTNGEDPGGKAQNVNWNRNLALDECISLEWLIANDSKVWMTTNRKGNPDDQYFNAATDRNLQSNVDTFYYFTDKKLDLYIERPNDLDDAGDPDEQILTRRDYIDVMTDRTTLPDGSEGPDYATNVNTEHGAGHINTAGAGMLAPVTYHIMSESWDEVKPPLQTTYYYIDKIKESTPSVQVKNSALKDKDNTRIVTEGRSKTTWVTDNVIKNDDDSPVIIVEFPDAATDINGKTHNVIVEINKITFTNPDHIPNRTPNRLHDTSNVYVDDVDNMYYRDVLSYGKGLLRFLNYAREVDGLDRSIIKNDAGTDIDFSIKIEDALPNTSVLFFIDDLDIPASQTYDYPDNDACHDNLPWTGVSYDDHSEGVVLREGNDLGTLQFSEHTGLKEDEKTVGGEDYVYIHGTGSDPSGTNDGVRGSTGWSAFSVKADAKKSNYTWVSGIGCTTDFLNPTEGTTLDDVVIRPDALKTVNNKIPTGDYVDAFKFQLVKASEVKKVTVDGEEYDNLAGTASDKNLTAPDYRRDLTNDVDLIDIGELEFSHPKSVGNEHAVNVYVYRLHEVVPNAAGDVLSYNTTHVTRFLKVVVSNPKSDIEMEKGVKAEVTIGRYYSDATDEEWKDEWDDEITDTINWDDWSQVVWSLDTEEKGQRWQENRIVNFPRTGEPGSTPYEVKKDVNNVEYIAVPASIYHDDPSKDGTVYLDANNPYVEPDSEGDSPSILVETVEGDVYPYDVQEDVDWKAENHPDERLSRPVKVDDKQVYVDVHGNLYIADGADYYEVNKSGSNYTKGSKLTVKDGEFNPDSNYDKELFVDWEIDGSKVMIDYQGQRYYLASDGKYKDPGDDPENVPSDPRVLVLGTVGKVMPKSTDKSVTHDRTEGAILVINGNTVYETAAGQLYYKKDGNYYSVMDTLLTPGKDEFEPDAADEPHETDFDIMVDDKNTEDESDDTYYYRSDDLYYIYAPNDPTLNGKPLAKEDIVHPGDVDHTKMNLGVFNNKVKQSNIIIGKKVIDGANDAAERSGVFDYIIEFRNSSGDLTDIDLTEFQFTPASPGGFDRIEKGRYKFQLTEEQEVKIYNVPFNTTYTITEPVSDEDGAELNLNGWELVKVESTSVYDSDSPETKTPVTTNDRSVTRTILTEDDEFHTHTFFNRYTEVLVDKVVNIPDDVDKTSFSFVADIDVTGLQPNMEFSYGYMDEDQNGHFKKATADVSGEAEVQIDFELNKVGTDGKVVKGSTDIALVIPQGSTVKVTETENPDYLTRVALDNATPAPGLHKTHEGSAVINPHNPTTSKKPEIHFINSYVKPAVLPADSIEAEKILEGRSWRTTDEFDFEIEEVEGAPVPVGTKEDPENPGETIEFDDINTIVSNADTATANGYKDGFGAITYSLKDMKKTDGTYETEKTFTYYVRENDADITTLVDEIPGITYSDEEYMVEVVVEMDETDPDKPELKIKSYKIYEYDGAKGDEVSIASFTNTYDVDETTHQMTAYKWVTDVDTETTSETITANEYSFILKPIGDNAAVAPMPTGTTGTGANRTYEVGNSADRYVHLGGITFNYQDLLEAGISDIDLHSDEGVTFEYEVYEVVPNGAVNNNDGTYSLTDSTGNVTIYDGIHHSRKIVAKIIIDSVSGDPVLDIESKADMSSGDFYIDKDGNKKDAKDAPGYQDADHHLAGGAPKFHNYYFEQKFADLKLAKAWHDLSDVDGIRPDSVTVNVKNDATPPMDEDVEITGSSWEKTLKDLPVYQFDKETKTVKKIKYTITEKEEGPITGDSATGYIASYNHVMPVDLIEYDVSDPIVREVKVNNSHDPFPGEMNGDETWGGKGETQTGELDYDVNPNNHVTPNKLILPDAEGATINDEGNTVTIPGEGEYVLNSDGTVTFTPEADFVGDPTPVDVQGIDIYGNHIKATYTPHVVDNEEKITKTHKISYVYEDGSPVLDEDGNPLVDERTRDFTRTGTVDPDTGEITWPDWEPQDLPEKESPEIDGYTPDKDSIPAKSGTPDDWPEDDKVVYKKNPEPEKPTWIDGSPYETEDTVRKVQTGTLTFKPGKDSPISHVRLIDPETGEETEALEVDVFENGVKIGRYKLNPKGTVNRDGTISYEITFTPEGDYTGKPTPITLRAYDENGNYADGIYQPNVIGPDKPDPKTPDKPADKKGAAKTGDETNIAIWVALLAAAVLLIVFLLFLRRKQK